MKSLSTITFLIILMPLMALSQTDRTPPERVDPDAMVAIDDDTKFEEAVSILDEFAREYEDRSILLKNEVDGKLGIHIPLMHWRRALDYLAGYHDMDVVSQSRHYELVKREDVSSKSKTSDSLSGFDDGDKIINQNTREIEISATFFEGNSRLLREIGVDWSTLSSDGRVQVDQRGAMQVGQDIFDINLDLSDLVNGWDIHALFSAFESNNEGEIIASPKIRIMDGKEGNIQVGQDFSIKSRDFAGNVIDEFFSTGTILNVTPHIIESDDMEFIYMTVAAERSSATPDPVSTVINKQEADTEILMLSGESTTIAGLYDVEESVTRRGIPLLKDLPPWFFGLRYLFGYNSSEVTTQELVILIQAKIIPDLDTRILDLQTDTNEVLQRELQEYRGLELEEE